MQNALGLMNDQVIMIAITLGLALCGIAALFLALLWPPRWRLKYRYNGKEKCLAFGTYPDVSLYHVIAGLRYALPRAMAKIEPDYPRLVALHDKVAALPKIKAYLKSKRRQPFNDYGLFRHYPELDG